MQTLQRVTKAYFNARQIEFDKDSKYIFFSDCHRGDGSHFDEFTKNQNLYLHALNYYYKNGFTYVEVGDGDELWEQPKLRFIKKAHYDVFEVIRKFHYHNRLIVIYGNHNMYLKYPEYVEKYYHTYYNEYREQHYDFLKDLKPVEAIVLKHKETQQEIVALHGHQGDFANDHVWMLTMLSLRYFWRYMHSFGVKNPASPVKNAHKRHKIERNYNKWINVNKKMLICGHTHRFKFPRTGELPYFNTGSCIYPTTITGIEIAKDKVQVIRWKIRPNREGVLRATREVIRGPEEISKFDMR